MSHKRTASRDQIVVLLVDFLQTTVKTKSEEVFLVGTEEAGEMKGLQPLFSRKVKCIQSHNTLGWGGEHLGNWLHFRGEERERATQQNSWTLWAQHIRQGQGVKSEEGADEKKAASEAFTCAGSFSTMHSAYSRTIKATTDCPEVKRSSSYASSLLPIWNFITWN